MRYFIFPFTFTSSVHFGNTNEGGSLDKVQLTISSDTFVSACVNEIGYNQTEVDWLIESLQFGNIKISSLFPFTNLRKELELFLPRPIYAGKQKSTSYSDSSAIQESVKEQKKLKKIAYVRSSHLYNEEGVYSIGAIKEVPFFGQFLTAQKVSLRTEKSRPYVVGSFKFAPGAGLYCIVGVENEDDIDRIKSMFEGLGYTGIGGKRSSGYGQFIVEDKFELDEVPVCRKDIAALYQLLHQDGPIFMSISAVTPLAGEIEETGTGTYKLMRRSGFVYSESAAEPYKRNSFYALQEGSCMQKALQGQVIELNHEKSSHPIYKNMTGFWLGVNIDE